MTGDMGLACIVTHPRGIDLLVKAHAGSKKTGVLGLVGDLLKLGVSAPPEDGRANEALLRLIAELLEVRLSSVTLVTGKTAKNKRFRIEGVDSMVALAFIQSQLDNP